MNDANPKNVFDALKWFLNYKISFHGSLVPLPHLVGLDDLQNTIEYLDQAGAVTVRALLPGDQIIPVAGREVLSRVDAFQLLSAECNPMVKVNRRGKIIELVLDKKSNQSDGLAVAYDLDPGQVDRVRSYLTAGGETLMLVSKPALKR